MTIFLIAGIVASYLIGSLSSAIILCKLMHLPDPRTSGSGNPGATNVLRIAGKKAAFFTLLGDLLKGLLPVLIARASGCSAFYLSLIMLAAFLGHLYPIFFKFKGGKGVATGIGGLLGLNALVGLLAIITWIIVAKIWRYSSLAAIVAAISIPIYNIYLGDKNAEGILLIMLALMLWRHRGNIKRLLRGEETRLKNKKI